MKSATGSVRVVIETSPVKGVACRRAPAARQQRVGPKVVAVDVRQLVTAECLLGASLTAFEGHDRELALGEYLGGGGTRGPRSDDADVCPVRLGRAHG